MILRNNINAFALMTAPSRASLHVGEKDAIGESVSTRRARRRSVRLSWEQGMRSDTRQSRAGRNPEQSQPGEMHSEKSRD
jgi:hypothetical protein